MGSPLTTVSRNLCQPENEDILECQTESVCIDALDLYLIPLRCFTTCSWILNNNYITFVYTWNEEMLFLFNDIFQNLGQITPVNSRKYQQLDGTFLLSGRDELQFIVEFPP